MQTLTLPENFIKTLSQGAAKTYLGSVTLMKQLTVAVVSTVVYFKDAFPKDSYNVENFGDLKLRILKKKCTNESAQFLSTALINAFDAFDKKYLLRLELCFYDDECRPENLLDCHTFEYTYDEAGGTVRVRSGPDAQAIEDRARAMLHSCTVFGSSHQNKLPPSFDIRLKLYYNEAAPEGYQAPGFYCGEEFQEHLSQAEMTTHLLEEFDTPYHGLRVTLRFNHSNNLCASHEAIASQNPPLMTQTQHYLGTSAPAGALRCPCGLGQLPPDVTSLITCHYCKTQQHAVCFGLLRGATGRGHCCVACADIEPARTPSCRTLAFHGNNSEMQTTVCSRRVVLAYCRARRVADAGALVALGLPPSRVPRLLDYLRLKQVFPHDDWSVPQRVNENRLREVMSCNFYDVQELGVVERLLLETRATQERRHARAADLLSPTEMGSMGEAGGVSGVGVELLQQYRQALATPRVKRAPDAFSTKHKAKRTRGRFD